jgi:hypothetical protein
MQAVATACPPVSSHVRDKLLQAESMRLQPEAFDRTTAAARLTALMNEAANIV